MNSVFEIAFDLSPSGIAILITVISVAMGTLASVLLIRFYRRRSLVRTAVRVAPKYRYEMLQLQYDRLLNSAKLVFDQGFAEAGTVGRDLEDLLTYYENLLLEIDYEKEDSDASEIEFLLSRIFSKTYFSFYIYRDTTEAISDDDFKRWFALLRRISTLEAKINLAVLEHRVSAFRSAAKKRAAKKLLAEESVEPKGG